MAYIPFINTDTGEIDHAAVVERGDLRACREWGGPNPPPLYVRAAHSWCIERAHAERRAWQRDHNQPVDGEEVLVTGFTPDWGSSGDSFRRGSC
jgi:hypothetical protein